MKRWTRDIVPPLIALLFCAGAYFLWPRESAIHKRLHGDLAEVSMQSERVSCGAWWNSPPRLREVESWLHTLRAGPAAGAGEDALAQKGGRIALMFRDGHREAITFRWCLQPSRSALCCGDFHWEGREVTGGSEPFSAWLHATAARKLRDFRFTAALTRERVVASWGEPDFLSGFGMDYRCYWLPADQSVSFTFDLSGRVVSASLTGPAPRRITYLFPTQP